MSTVSQLAAGRAGVCAWPQLYPHGQWREGRQKRPHRPCHETVSRVCQLGWWRSGGSVAFGVWWGIRVASCRRGLLGTGFGLKAVPSRGMAQWLLEAGMFCSKAS